MSSIVISGDTSGAITLSAPAVSGTNTATIPAATGTVMVSGNMPAFSAYNNNSAQAISNNTATKVVFGAKDFDTNSNFASSTFTPTVAGYYQINAVIYWQSSPLSATLGFYKNGALWKFGSQLSANGSIINGSCIVFCNGSTDYVEVYATQGSGVSSNIAASTITSFSGCLVRTS